MTDREKLIEIISGSGMLCEICGENTFMYCAEALTDHILANGVMFATDTNVGSKWISVEDRLPETNDTVLVLHKNRHVCTNAWLKKKWWIDYGRNPITHWMPLPEPPKED